MLWKGIQHKSFFILSPQAPQWKSTYSRGTKNTKENFSCKRAATLGLPVFTMLFMSVCLCTHALFAPNASPYFSHTSAWGPLAHPAKPLTRPFLGEVIRIHYCPSLLITPPLCLSLVPTSQAVFLYPQCWEDQYILIDLNHLKGSDENLCRCWETEGKVLSSVLSSQEGSGLNSMGISTCIT